MLENDGLAVRAHCRPSHVAGFERAYLLGLAARFRDAPEVGEPVAVSIADKINVAVRAPHRPRIFSVKVGNVGEFLGGYVHHGYIGLISAAIVLPPINLAFSIDREFLAVRRVTAPHAHVGAGASLHAAVYADRVELAHEVFAAIACEKNGLGIGIPSEHRIVGRVKGQLFCGAAFGRNDEHIKVAVAVAREGDPLAVWRKSGINIPSLVDGQPANVLAVFVSGPDIAEICKGDSAVVIMGISHQFRLAPKRGRWYACEKSKNEGDKPFHIVSSQCMARTGSASSCPLTAQSLLDLSGFRLDLMDD